METIQKNTKIVEYETSDDTLTIQCLVEFESHYEVNPFDRETPPYHGEEDGTVIDHIQILEASITNNMGNTIKCSLSSLIDKIGIGEYRKLKEWCYDHVI